MKKTMSFITTNCGGHLGNSDLNTQEDTEEPLINPATIPIPEPEDQDKPLLPTEFNRNKTL